MPYLTTSHEVNFAGPHASGCRPCNWEDIFLPLWQLHWFKCSLQKSSFLERLTAWTIPCCKYRSPLSEHWRVDIDLTTLHTSLSEMTVPSQQSTHACAPCWLKPDSSLRDSSHHALSGSWYFATYQSCNSHLNSLYNLLSTISQNKFTNKNAPPKKTGMKIWNNTSALGEHMPLWGKYAANLNIKRENKDKPSQFIVNYLSKLIHKQKHIAKKDWREDME